MFMCVSVYTCTHTYIHVHAHIHTYIYMHTYTFIHTCIHIHSYTHTNIHAYTHTYTHTYTSYLIIADLLDFCKFLLFVLRFDFLCVCVRMCVNEREIQYIEKCSVAAKTHT
jgi:hypothetical protein